MLHYNQRLWCFFEPEASWSDLPFGWSWLSTALYSVDTFSLSLPLESLPLYSAIAFSLHFEGEKLIKVAATENNLFKSHFSRENCDTRRVLWNRFSQCFKMLHFTFAYNLGYFESGTFAFGVVCLWEKFYIIISFQFCKKSLFGPVLLS